MNVLLVDDQEIDRELIKHTLNSSGKLFEITEVNNAFDGIESLANTAYDIILMDYQMPKMNGIEMLQELKKKTDLKQSAIIVMSHNNNEDVMIECINAGAQDFLLKDEVTSNQLLRCIRQSRKRYELEDELYSSFKQVKALAEHDQLTGLYNRYHFEESLRSLLVNPRGIKGHIVVMLMDLDNFKFINDSFGHAVGDKLLVMLSKRVKEDFRESELFARLGGDEFAFVFTGIKYVKESFQVAKRILDIIDAPFEVDGHLIHCSGSIGIAINSKQGNEVDELVKFADIAMYRAKKKGKNVACLFEDNMESDFYRAYKLENELRQAVVNEEFVLHYQPIYEANTRNLAGFEALIRWPTGTLTTRPDEFIPVAEQTRLIEPLGRWILTESIAQFASWVADKHDNLFLSINLSPLQLHDLNLLTFIKDLIIEFGVRSSNIVLEITETALLNYNEATLETLEQLRAFGCQLALDDFGTGYSSISHLLNYPIDIVKFDKSLIDGAVCNTKHKAIIKGLTDMLNTLDIVTVAEGIETKAQMALCEQLGVNRLQGYFFNKPMEVQACKNLLAGS